MALGVPPGSAFDRQTPKLRGAGVRRVFRGIITGRPQWGSTSILTAYLKRLDKTLSACVSKAAQRRKIHENTLFLTRRYLKHSFEISTVV